LRQVRKRPTDDQVRGLIERYLRKEIERRRGSPVQLPPGPLYDSGNPL